MKQPEEPGRLSFDEQRALHDLEELQRQIERVRGQRKGAEAEFDQFLRGFRPGERQPEAAKAIVPVSERNRDTMADTPPAYRAAASDPARVPQKRAVSAPFFADTVESPERATPQRPRIATPVIVAVAAIVVVAGIFAMRGTRSAPESQASSPSPATTPGEPAADPPAPQPPESSAAVAPRAAEAVPQGGVNLEIVTLKPVWVRVTIDGRKAIERELPPGQRIPVHGERSILIRAGNAGGIAISRNGGAETVLGPEGLIATREFTVDAGRGSTPVR